VSALTHVGQTADTSRRFNGFSAATRQVHRLTAIRNAMPHHDHAPHDHDHGLGADLERLIRQAANRRRALRWLVAGGSAGLLQACGGGGDDSATGGTTSGGGTTTTTPTTGTGTGTGTTSCSLIPEETAGPYPGDGSNSSQGSVANALMLSGILRSDIRSSVAGATGTAQGTPMKLTLKLVDSNASCAVLSGYAVYLWHCDAGGNYSMYSSSVVNQNYLRGVQVSDANGELSFTTIVPGCYAGRWPHIHFEVYRSATTATSFSNKLRTSQLALPQAMCEQVYAQSVYAGSTANLRGVSLSSDNVFSDGSALQLASVAGDNTNGYTASLQVAVSV
jgi:protocatechuate 3,4-dioxygenase beta subunit